MKKNIISFLASNSIVIAICTFFSKRINAIIKEKGVTDRINDERKLISKYNKIFDQQLVLNGPFKGLRYPNFISSGSRILPKLLGSYESEIHQDISELASLEINEIFDIGCAEGYYAVGFAKIFPKSKIHAFDTNPVAQKRCESLARENGVSHQLEIRSACTANFLGKHKFVGINLVFADCEGYEDKLFDKKNVHNLKNCFVLIELHEFLIQGITNKLIKLFESTHKYKLIPTVDKIVKARESNFQELGKMSYEEQMTVLEEKRPGYMEWMYLSPLSSGQHK